MEYVFSALAWCLGGIIGGATGIGGVMVAMPILTLAISPSDAIPISVIVGLFGTLQLAVAYRKFCVFREIRDLVIGCVPGCIAGSMVLKISPVEHLQLMISAMLFCFIAMRIFRRAAVWHLPDSTGSGIAAGAICGFVSGAVAMVGAPLGIYALLKHWDPNRARGNMSGFYVAVSVAAVASQAWAGLYSYALIPNAAAGVAGCFAGSLVGVRLGRYMDPVLFQRIILAFLALSAAVLFLRAI